MNATELCNAQQPDNATGRCIRYKDHAGPHQTFVAEWNEGDALSRRRVRPAGPAPAANTGHSRHAKRPPRHKPPKKNRKF